MFFRKWVSDGFSCITFHILSMEVQHFCELISEQYRKHVNFALVNLSRRRIVCVCVCVCGSKTEFSCLQNNSGFTRISNFVFMVVLYGCMD